MNVIDYGAVGDGVHDDGPAFQSCGDAVIAAGGGEMFLPDGYNFRIVTSCVWSFGGLYFTMRGPGAIVSLAQETNSGEIFRLLGNQASSFYCDGVRFNGIVGHWSCGNLFSGSVPMFFNRCSFFNVGALDQVVRNVNAGLKITNSLFVGCSAYGSGNPANAAVVFLFAPGLGGQFDQVWFNDTGDEWVPAAAAFLCNTPGGYNQGAPIHGLRFSNLTFGEVISKTIVVNSDSNTDFKWLNVVVEDCVFQQQQQILSRSVEISRAERVELKRNQYTWESAPERVAIELSHVDVAELTHERCDVQAPVNGHGGGSNKIIIHDTVKRVDIDQCTYKTLLCDAGVTTITQDDGLRTRLRIAAAVLESNLVVKSADDASQIVLLETTDNSDQRVGVTLDATAYAESHPVFGSAADIATHYFFVLRDINDVEKVYEFSKDGGGTTPGYIQVAITTGMTAAQVAAVVVTAVNGSGQAITASAGSGGTVDLVATEIGEEGNTICSIGNMNPPALVWEAVFENGKKRLRVVELASQQVPVKSDGADELVPGDRVELSTNEDGRITKLGTGKCFGVVRVGAAATLDAVAEVSTTVL